MTMCMLTVLTWLHEETAVLLPESESWPRHMSLWWKFAGELQRAKTWLFTTKLDWQLTNPGRKCWIPKKKLVSNVIDFACSHIDGQDLLAASIEGCAHGNKNILRGSLKRCLPMNSPGLPDCSGSGSSEQFIAWKKIIRSTIHTASSY